jgi:hypothetical protein
MTPSTGAVAGLPDLSTTVDVPPAAAAELAAGPLNPVPWHRRAEVE